MVYLSFNRFRIKGSPLQPGHTDWQEIAHHPARRPKNRYELRRRDKIVSRSAVPFPPSRLGSAILRRSYETTAFSCGLWRTRGTWALGEIPAYRYDRVVMPQIGFSAALAVGEEERKRTRRARSASPVILISDES